MSSQPQRRYSLDDYFAVEAMSVTKHEYYRGEIFAMAGASLEHNRVTLSVLTSLRNALRGARCEAFGSDLRIGTPSGLYTYPDVSVICGGVKLLPDRPDTATNPVLLIEVSSVATRDYDRGEKFALYKTIPTLREYVLIDADRPLLEQFSKSGSGAWRLHTYRSLADVVSLASVDVEVSLQEAYRRNPPRPRQLRRGRGLG